MPKVFSTSLALGISVGLSVIVIEIKLLLTDVIAVLFSIIV